jgi:SPIRAL1-like protein
MKPTNAQLDDLLRPVLLKDLRINCRARGLNPGGGRETLFDRLKEDMLATGNLEMTSDAGAAAAAGAEAAAARAADAGAAAAEGGAAPAALANNYVRPEGQNTGNFLTGRPSSRVLAPPGGGTSIHLG